MQCICSEVSMVAHIMQCICSEVSIAAPHKNIVGMPYNIVALQIL